MSGAIPILRMGDVLLTTVHVELRDAVAEAFQADVLAAIENGDTSRVWSSTSAVSTWSTPTSRASWPRPGRMARLMGTDTVLCGMRPEIAATLVRMGYMMEGVNAALDLDEGLALLRVLRAKEVGSGARGHHDDQPRRDADRGRGRRHPRAPRRA